MSLRNLSVLIVALACVCGAQAAVINVPGGSATIQGAINIAANGDTISIGAGTYAEDLFIPGSSLQSKNNLTLQPANPGDIVIIDAPNTTPTSPATRGLYGLIQSLLGAPGVADHHGFIIEGDGITLNDLTIINNSSAGDPAVGEAAAVLALGNNLTLNNCTLIANPDNDVGRAFYQFTGNYGLLNAALGGAIAAAGYMAPRTCLNTNLTDCTLQNGDSTFDTVDAARYLAIALAGLFIPAVDGTGTLTRIDISGHAGGGNFGEFDCGNYTWVDSNFHHANDAADIGGGTWTFNGCTFTSSLNNNMIAVESNLAEANAVNAAVAINDCLFCGTAADNRLVRMSEGNLTVANTIFNITATAANTVAGILYSPGDYDSDWLLTGGYPASSSVIVDNCDFYNPLGRGITGDDPQTAGEPVGNLTVTDSIIQADAPVVLDGVAGPVARNANINNNDLFTIGTQINNVASGWVVTSAFNLNVDPGYPAPQTCNPLGYKYTNTTLATAGTGGTPLGSQGQGAEAASVGDWSLYQ